MLRQSEVNAGFSLASSLNSRGVIAEARSGTVLSDVCSTTRLAVAEDAYNWDLGTASLLTGLAEVKDTAGRFAHGEKIEAALSVAATAIQEQLIFARNTVNPIIERIVNAVEQAEADRGGEAALRPEIIPFFYSELWSNSSWLATVERFAEVAASRVNVRERCADPMGDDLTKWVMTGAPALDKDITDMLAVKPEAWLISVYRGVFQQEQDTLREMDMIGTSDQKGWFFSNSRRCIDEAAVAYLLARGILREAPEWLSDRLKEDLATVVNAAGLRCQRVSNHRQEDKKNDLLVYSYGIYGGANGARVGQVFVNGDVYNDFLNKGGSPELLMGSAYGPRLRRTEEFTVARQELENRYKAHEARISEIYASERLGRYNELLRAELINEMRKIPDEALYCSREEMVVKIRQCAGDLRVKDIDALWEYVRRGVCRIFFPHTNALAVLVRYDDTHSRMPDADPRVVGFYAAVELLTEWAYEAMEFSLVR